MEDTNELSEFSSIRGQKDLSPTYRPYVPKNNSIAKLNRHTNEPHEHKREVARRIKQKLRHFYAEANTGCPPGHGCKSHIKTD